MRYAVGGLKKLAESARSTRPTAYRVPPTFRVPMLPLPIDEHLPALIAALQTHACAVLRAETGAGKTTRVPPAILDAGLAADKQIVLLQPRRLAARAAAARISQERGTSLGELVGYEVRFDRRASR